MMRVVDAGEEDEEEEDGPSMVMVRLPVKLEGTLGTKNPLGKAQKSTVNGRVGGGDEDRRARRETHAPSVGMEKPLLLNPSSILPDSSLPVNAWNLSHSLGVMPIPSWYVFMQPRLVARVFSSMLPEVPLLKSTVISSMRSCRPFRQPGAGFIEYAGLIPYLPPSTLALSYPPRTRLPSIEVDGVVPSQP